MHVLFWCIFLFASVTRLGEISPFGRIIFALGKIFSGVYLLLGDFLGKILFTLGEFFFKSIYYWANFFQRFGQIFFQTIWSHWLLFRNTGINRRENKRPLMIRKVWPKVGFDKVAILVFYSEVAQNIISIKFSWRKYVLCQKHENYPIKSEKR